MTAFFDEQAGTLRDLRTAGATYQEYYNFDEALLATVALDVNAQWNEHDKTCRFPADLADRVYRLFHAHSAVANPDIDFETAEQHYMHLHRLVEGLHDIYHERAQRGHPNGDSVHAGQRYIISLFIEASNG